MKNISYTPLFLFVAIFSALCSSQLMAHETLLRVVLKNNRAVNIIKLDVEDKDIFARGKEVFMKVFYDSYKEYTPEQLYLENKPGYLKNLLEAAFEDEENDFNNQKKGSLFVVVQDAQSNEIIGFVAYDSNDENKKVYIRQLAVDYAYKNQGLGKALVIDTIKKIMQNAPVLVTVCTRKINEPAIGFYRKLNFQDAPMEEVHPELPAYKYCGFKLNLNDK